MPAVQTSYPLTLRPALAGMKADMTPEVTISRVVEGSSGIGFGVAAFKGTGDRQVTATAAATGFIGVTLLDPTITHLAPQASPDFYPQYDVCVVLQKGTVWVLASGGAVTANQPAYFNTTTGAFTSVSTGATLIPNAVFESSGASGALVILKLK